MPIVSNSRPLIIYARTGRLHLLRELYAEVLVPPAVHREVVLQAVGRSGAAEVLAAPWIRTVHEIGDPQIVAALMTRVDPGEAEAIALSNHLGAGMSVILDDRSARRLAAERGIGITGSAGVLVTAKQVGAIPLVHPVLDELLAAGLG